MSYPGVMGMEGETALPLEIWLLPKRQVVKGYELPWDTQPCITKFCSDHFKHPYSYPAWPWVCLYLFPTLLSSLASENHTEISHTAENRAPVLEDSPQRGSFARHLVVAAGSLPHPMSHIPTTDIPCSTSPQPQFPHPTCPHPTSPCQRPRACWGWGRGWDTAVPQGAGDPQHPSALDTGQVPSYSQNHRIILIWKQV